VNECHTVRTVLMVRQQPVSKRENRGVTRRARPKQTYPWEGAEAKEEGKEEKAGVLAGGLLGTGAAPLWLLPLLSPHYVVHVQYSVLQTTLCVLL
jgi:hypothetical protein